MSVRRPASGCVVADAMRYAVPSHERLLKDEKEVDMEAVKVATIVESRRW
jgi:hypothetical protein